MRFRFPAPLRVIATSAIIFPYASPLSTRQSQSVPVDDQENKEKKSQLQVKEKKIVIAGGGTGGIGVAGMLRAEGFKNVTIIEPKGIHYYQPLWTLVGGGLKKIAESHRPMRSLLSKETKWIQKPIKSFDPKNCLIELNDETKVPYDYLVVALGVVTRFDKIPGAEKALNDKESGVISVYDPNYVVKTSHVLSELREGKAIFTMPTTPVKCPGAAQKIMWLFEGQDRRNFIRDKVSIEYWIPAQAMFGIPKYSEILTKLADQRNIIRQFNKQLVSVNENKTAVFYDSMTKLNQTVPFDVLHIVPPMCPPDCLLGSPLSNVDGYVAVDQYTLQSERYPNIFALGDCTSLPTSKTAAAVISQAPVLVHNLKKEITGQTLNGRYDGYTSCPLVLSKNEVLLAEFGYDKKIMETFSPATGRFPCSLIGQEGEMHRRFFFWMNQNLFPFVYWNLWTRGRWFGRNGLWKPDVTKK